MTDASDAPVGYFELANGEVRGWAVEGAAIHLKCVTKYGDPVELGAEEIRELCAQLLELVNVIE